MSMISKKKFIVTLSLTLVLLLTAGVALAHVFLSWRADSIAFVGRIEQPSSEAQLILTVNGEVLADSSDITGGEESIFPLLLGTIHQVGGRDWVDSTGKAALNAPTYVITTSDGSAMDNLVCQIQIHNLAPSPDGLPADVAEAMRFGVVANSVQRTKALSGISLQCQTENLADGYAATRWIELPYIPEGGSMEFNLSAWAAVAAEGDFYIEAVFSTIETVENYQ